MQYITTLEGYPALLKNPTRTPTPFFSERALMRANRTAPWVYLTQNPKGRWQVLVPDPNERGSVLCVAGGKTAEPLLPAMTRYAYEHDIFKYGAFKTLEALRDLGSFVSCYGGPEGPNAAR